MWNIWCNPVKQHAEKGTHFVLVEGPEQKITRYQNSKREVTSSYLQTSAGYNAKISGLSLVAIQ
jgi:hypothetical protein